MRLHIMVLIGLVATTCFLPPETPAAEYSIQKLHDFDRLSRIPRGVVLGPNGTFFGASEGGGANDHGSIFRVDANGSFATIFSFDGTNGSGPSSPLLHGNNGNLFGTTYFPGGGTIFEITLDGVLLSWIPFDAPNAGYHPWGRLTEASNGNIYGTTVGNRDPSRDAGSVFQFKLPGALTTLGSFNRGENYDQPLGSLVEGPDGMLYGTSSSSPPVVFKLDFNGALTLVVRLADANGYGPTFITLSRDGKFYGTTGQGGAFGRGTFFRMTPNGALDHLASFTADIGSFSNPIIEARDGYFYGTTRHNTNVFGRFGRVFRASKSGELSTLAVFDGGNGHYPVDALVEAPDGNLYGTTRFGGKHDSGTFFRLVKVPSLTITSSEAGSLHLSWNSFPGAVYRIERRETLLMGTWNLVAANVSATGGTTSFTISLEGSKGGFYRVVLLP